MENLLKKSLVQALETGADLLNILHMIMDSAEYEDDHARIDIEVMDVAKEMLHDLSPEPQGNTTLH